MFEKEEKTGSAITGTDLAVVGMAVRFPGAVNINEFWENLKGGVESLWFFSDEELEQLDSQSVNHPGFVRSKGGVLEDKECFDAAFFDYTPVEAEVMDPQLRVFHECCWEALEHAGVNPGTYDGLIGLYAGASNNFNWQALSFLSGKSKEIGDFAASHLNDKDYLCTRVSHKLDLKGPAVAVSSACSTSLLAIHMACQAILNAECDMALAGGVTIDPGEKTGYIYQEGMILSPDGHCRAFDAKAKGTVGGDGAGVVVLKLLTDALNQGDYIHAVVKGTAVNNDGTRRSGFTAPSREGQSDVIGIARQVAEVEPESITYVETHGTGTPLGDPVEIEALTRAFAVDKKGYCAIGSVKTNVGHLGAAAGAAGFIKTVLALKHRLIPPSLYYESPNPNIDFKNTPFFVNTEPREWKNDRYPLRAGVSSFGIGGTNAHVILEEAPVIGYSSLVIGEKREQREHQLILLSAKTSTALEKITGNLVSHLKENPGINIADAAYTLQVGRKPLQYKRILVCSQVKQAVEALSTGDTSKVHSFFSKDDDRPVVFMFPGIGAQYVNMGLELYQKEPVFRREMDRCFQILNGLVDYDIKEILYPEEINQKFLPGGPGGAVFTKSAPPGRRRQDLHQTEIAQPVIFIFEYALAKLLMQWGIRPRALVGYSFGEYAAACLSGVLSLEDALKVVVYRARLIQGVGQGVMLSVPLSREEAAPFIQHRGDLSLSIDNGASCIISGPVHAIEAFEKEMKNNRYICMRLAADRAVHSKMMAPILKAFEEYLMKIPLNKPQIPYISNVTGTWITVEQATSPRCWATHLRETVLYAKGIKELIKIPKTIFIEIGPGGDLSAVLQRYIENNPQQQVVNLVRPRGKNISDMYYLLNKLGRLWSYGLGIDWSGFYRGEKRQRVPLPTYPFEGERYWQEADLSQGAAGLTGKDQQPDFADWFGIPSWKRQPVPHTGKQEVPKKSVWLVFMDACGVGTMVVERLKHEGHAVITVTWGEEYKKLADNAYILEPSQKNGYDVLFDELCLLKQMPDRVLHFWGVNRAAWEPGQMAAGTGFAWFEQAQKLGFYSLLYLAKAIAKKDHGTIHITVITNNMQHVAGEEVLCPEKSTVLAPMKVIPQEQPSIICRSIDIDLVFSRLGNPGGSPVIRNIIQQLWTELSMSPPEQEPVVAFRDNHRWVQTFEPVHLEQDRDSSLPLKEKGVYLITGGWGEIGLILARYLAEHFSARLILTGRSAFPGRDQWDRWLANHDREDPFSLKINKIKELEELGAQVLVFRADAGSREQMEQVIRETKTRFGSINGVIHGAGITRGETFKVVQKIEKKHCHQQFQAKVYGLLILEELLRTTDQQLDFCWVISSLSAVLGGLEFVAYAAGNIFMDAYIHLRNRIHTPSWISVDWDGMSAKKTVEGFKRTLALRSINQVVVSNGGNLQDRIDRWIKLRSLREEEVDREEVIPSLKPRPQLMTPYVEPRDPVEQSIALIWQRLFGYESIGVRDDFFELGGDSLKAITLISRIHQALKVEIPLIEFFKRLTIESIGEYVVHVESSVFPGIPYVEEKEYYVLSPAQKRLYILQQMEKDSIGYNEKQAVTLEGMVDKKKLEKTFRKLIERHESLRTSIRIVGEKPVQVIHHEVEFEVEYHDASQVDEEPDRANHHSSFIIHHSFVRPFDLSRAPFMRVALIKIGPQHYILVVDQHHIITDAVSQQIFVKELMALYGGKELSPLRIRYKDYAEWQNRKTQQEAVKDQEEYWKNQFEGEVPILSLPCDYPRPMVRSFEGSTLNFALEQETTRALKNLALAQGVTLNMLLLAISYLLLAKVTGQEDIVIGTPIAGRKYEELNSLIGIFINILALRNYPVGQKSVREFLQEIKKRTLIAFENQDYPFEELVDQLAINRDMSRNPLFDVTFALQSIEIQTEMIPEIKIPGLKLKPYGSQMNVSKYDITINASEMGNQLVFMLGYYTKLFKHETIQRFAGYLKAVIHTIIRDIEQKISGIEVLTEQEKTRLLVELTHAETAVGFPRDKTLHELFEQQVEKTPDNAALVGSRQYAVGKEVEKGLAPWSITYRELNCRANRLARVLRGKGITANGIVGIMTERSPGMIVGLLGIIKAGGAYLPLDTDSSRQRIRYMMEDAGSPLLVTTNKDMENHSFTVLQGWQRIKHQPQVTLPRPQIKDFNGLPIPDRSLVNYEAFHRYIGLAMVKYTIALQGTRGCPYNCAYCHKIWPKNHVVRWAENIFEEMRLYYNMGVRRFVIVDDIFNLNRKNSTRFFQLIIDSGWDVQLFFPNGVRGDILTKDYIDTMVKAGTTSIGFALETASPRLQKLINKNLDLEKLRENLEYFCEKYPHVILELYMMHGFPTETEEEAQMTLDFVKRLKWVHFPYFHILKIYPNTDMEKLAIESGIPVESIAASENLAFHELPETLPFDKNVTVKCQSEFLDEYFLLKERLLAVLPYQMQVLTEDEIVQKYNSYLPVEINCFADLLQFAGIGEDELGPFTLAEDNYAAVDDLNQKLNMHFPTGEPEPDALRVMLLDLSQFFSHESHILYDVVEPPLGLMNLMTYLKQQLGSQVYGKIAKSRIDFDNYGQLKQLLDDFKPCIIGLRTLTFYKDFFHRTAAMIRQWGIQVPIIAGGPYATSDYQRILQDRNIDLVVLGEGEHTFTELIQRIIENNGNLPGDRILKQIPGIAFLPGEARSKKSIDRSVLFMDQLEDILSRQPPGNLKSLSQSNDLAYIIYTSGTTGKPKGVMIQHKNVVQLMKNDQFLFDFNENDVWTMFHSYNFDFSVWEMYGALLYGGKLVIIPKMLARDPERFLKPLKEENVTVLNQTPSAFYHLIHQEKAQQPNAFRLRYIIFGGEALSPIKLKGWKDKYPGIQLINMFGITETTVHVTYKEIGSKEVESNMSHIGQSLPTLNTYVMDNQLKLVLPGATGELCVAGEGVGRGYLNRPELTGTKFVENPYKPGERLYRSGDMVRMLDNGEMEYLGRLDHQVKIRGFRVELGEIEAQLLRHSHIQEAVVVAKESVTGRSKGKGETNANLRCMYICAYIVPDMEIPISGLRDYLLRHLPDYMIPSYFVPMHQLPLTANGKIDRKQLPDPEVKAGEDHVAPGSRIEKKLANIWAKELGIEKNAIGIDANFFELGGHSLNAAIVISKIHKELKVKVPLSELFIRQTIRGLARYIEGADKEGFESLEPAETREYYPLTPPQKRLYILQQMEKNNIAYNAPQVIQLGEACDRVRLEDTFTRLIRRHDSLRTSFFTLHDTPMQRVHDEVEFEIEYHKVEVKVEVEGKEAPFGQVLNACGGDLATEDTESTEEVVPNPKSQIPNKKETKGHHSSFIIQHSFFMRPFDLSHAPLLRVGLIRTKESKYVLMLDMHHIITDKVSQDILVRDFVQLDAGHQLPLLKLQYKDYAQWLNRNTVRQSIRKQEEYWLNRFKGRLPLLNLPADFRRPLINRMQGDRVLFYVNEQDTQRLKVLALEQGATLYMVVLALYTVLLARLSGQEDIIIGSPVAGRRHSDLEQIIGMMVGTLALRNYPFASRTFITFLKEVKQRTLEAFENQDYPFEELLEKVDVIKEGSRNPLFDVFFQFSTFDTQTTQPSEEESPPASDQQYTYQVKTAKFDLYLYGEERGERLFFSLEYSTQLFKPETIDMFITNFQEVVLQVTKNTGIQLKDITLSHGVYDENINMPETEFVF